MEAAQRVPKEPAMLTEVKLGLAKILSEQGNHPESLQRLDEIGNWLNGSEKPQKELSLQFMVDLYSTKVKTLVNSGRTAEAEIELNKMKGLIDQREDGRIWYNYYVSAAHLKWAVGDAAEATRLKNEGAIALLRSKNANKIERAYASISLGVCEVESENLESAEVYCSSAEKFLEGDESASAQIGRLILKHCRAVISLYKGDVEDAASGFAAAGRGFAERYDEHHPNTMIIRAMEAVALLEAKQGSAAYAILEKLEKSQGKRNHQKIAAMAGFGNADISELIPKAFDALAELRRNGIIRTREDGIKMLETLYGIWRAAAGSGGQNPFLPENSKRGFMAIERMVQLQKMLKLK